MNVGRAKEILESADMIDVTYDGAQLSFNMSMTQRKWPESTQSKTPRMSETFLS